MKVKEIVFCRASDIAAIVSHSNEVTNFVMNESGKWEEITGGGIFSIDFLQVPDFVKGRYIFSQNTSLDCAKTDETVEAFTLLSKSCELVFVNYLEFGGALIQGIELDEIASGRFTQSKISAARFKFDSSLVLGIMANLSSKSVTLAPKTGMTKEQLLNL